MKQGDKVTIRRRVNSWKHPYTPIGMDIWLKEQDQFIGETVTIKHVTEHAFSIEESDCMFPKSCTITNQPVSYEPD